MILAQIDIAQNIYAQWGALGLLLLVILSYMYFSMRMNMQQLKINYEDTRERLRELEEKNEKTENTFRDYLISNSTEQLEVIKDNTQAINNLVGFFDKSFGGYMKTRIEAHDRLSDNLDRFIRKIESNL